MDEGDMTGLTLRNPDDTGKWYTKVDLSYGEGFSLMSSKKDSYSSQCFFDAPLLYQLKS
jgi:hypothetical protein